jgi:hypothetical protein
MPTLFQYDWIKDGFFQTNSTRSIDRHGCGVAALWQGTVLVGSHVGNITTIGAMFSLPVVALTFDRAVKGTVASCASLERTTLPSLPAATVAFNKNAQLCVVVILTHIVMAARCLDV